MLKTNENVVEIDEYGYLEKYELENVLVNSLSMFFSDAIQLNKNISNSFSEFEAQRSDGIATFFLGTLERMYKDYQSVLILLCRGLQSQARSIMRNMLEKTIILKAVNDNHENLESWLKTQNRERNNTIRIIKGGYTHFTEEEIREMALEETEDTEYVSYKKWAERAGMIFDYAVIYHLFCSDTHHTMSAMNRHAFAEDNKLAGFTIAPDFDDLDYIITLAMHYMLIAVEIVERYLGLEICWIAPLQKKLDELDTINMFKPLEEIGR